MVDRVPESFCIPFIDSPEVVLGVLEGDHRRRHVEEHLQLHLLSPQRFFDPLAPGNVTRYSRKTNQVALRIPDLKTAVMNPTDGAITTSNSILNAHFRFVFHEPS